MINKSWNNRVETIIRWVARIWSILIFVFVLLIVVTPDPYLVKPIPLTDWIELGFYGVTTLGLLLAWRWEVIGGAITIAGVLGHEVVFRIIRGYWFPGLVTPTLLFMLPGILFLMCWALLRGKLKSAGPMNSRSKPK